MSRGRPPDSALIAMGDELEGLLVEFAMLEEAWPKVRRAVDRARTG